MQSLPLEPSEHHLTFPDGSVTGKRFQCVWLVSGTGSSSLTVCQMPSEVEEMTSSINDSCCS